MNKLDKEAGIRVTSNWLEGGSQQFSNCVATDYLLRSSTKEKKKKSITKFCLLFFLNFAAALMILREIVHMQLGVRKYVHWQTMLQRLYSPKICSED
jgi:hypothetical protein